MNEGRLGSRDNKNDAGFVPSECLGSPLCRYLCQPGCLLVGPAAYDRTNLGWESSPSVRTRPIRGQPCVEDRPGLSPWRAFADTGTLGAPRSCRLSRTFHHASQCSADGSGNLSCFSIRDRACIRRVARSSVLDSRCAGHDNYSSHGRRRLRGAGMVRPSRFAVSMIEWVGRAHATIPIPAARAFALRCR